MRSIEILIQVKVAITGVVGIMLVGKIKIKKYHLFLQMDSNCPCPVVTVGEIMKQMYFS